MSGSKSQGGIERRGALYVDGFNLYHPIHETGQNHLKWACLWRLGEMLCRPEGSKLVKVVFCTAVPNHLPGSFERHLTFNNAQIGRGVMVLRGHHVPADGGYSEKQSDINVALSVICDGEDDVYDDAFLLSADSDQVATAKFFSSRFASKGKRLFAPAAHLRTPTMPVTDADRQAAACLARVFLGNGSSVPDWIASGKLENHFSTEAFKAHREAAERAGAQAMRKLVAERRAIYLAKQERHDISAPDTLTEYEKVTHTIEALEWLDAEMARAIDPASLCRQTDQERA